MKAGGKRGNKEMLGRDGDGESGADFYFLFGYSFATIGVMRSLNERGVARENERKKSGRGSSF